MHLRTFVRTIKRTSTVLILVSILYAPLVTFAATPRPSCTLTAQTSIGTYTTSRKADMLLVLGESVNISWESTGAKTAERGNGKTIELSGTATHTPEKTSTYSYIFRNGNIRTACAITVHVVEGEFTESILTTRSTKPTLSGTASGTKNVQVQIFKEGSSKSLFISKSIPVKNGAWKTNVTKKLEKGIYDIVLVGDNGAELNTIAEEKLTIGTIAVKTEKKSGAIVAVSVPLLSGGIARGGSSIALSYLQVLNVSNEETTLKGFTVKQNGSASTDTITQLRISDDSGTYSNSVSANASSPLFKNGMAFIPLEVAIAPGQMRLFTVRAEVASTIQTHIGQQLKIDIVGVDSSANLTSKLPIRGVTWTFGF